MLDWTSLARAPHAEWLDGFRALLRCRREAIVPLVPRLRVGAAWHRCEDANTLAVGWPLDDGRTLTLRACIGRDDAHVVAPQAAVEIFATPREAHSRWAVAWYLEGTSNP
jgi:hypothetical protein